MTVIDTIYLCIAVAVVMLSVANPRGILWVTAFAVAYFASGFYWRSHGHLPEMVAGLYDTAIVVLVLLFARQLWELWVGVAAFLCLGVNIIYLANNLADAGLISHEVYSITLELLNLIALLTIGGVSAFVQRGSTDGIAFHPWVSFLGFARSTHRTNR